MVVYEKIYFEAYRNDQYIWHKNNIAQLYFILTKIGRTPIPRDGRYRYVGSEVHEIQKNLVHWRTSARDTP